MNLRECLVKDCVHIVPPATEANISVGIISSNEVPICQNCYKSTDPKVIKQVQEIKDADKEGLPF